MIDSLIAKANHYWRISIIEMCLIIAIVGILFCLIATHFRTKEAKDCIVYIEASGKLFYSNSLDDDDVINVPGPLGNTKIVLENNVIYIESSPCSDNFCKNAGAINGPREIITCHPNQVVIYIINMDE